MKTSLRIWASALTAAMAISSPTVARDGPETTVAYVGASAGLFSAWLIDWQQSSRVHVVNLVVTTSCSVSRRS